MNHSILLEPYLVQFCVWPHCKLCSIQNVFENPRCDVTIPDVWVETLYDPREIQVFDIRNDTFGNFFNFVYTGITRVLSFLMRPQLLLRLGHVLVGKSLLTLRTADRHHPCL